MSASTASALSDSTAIHMEANTKPSVPSEKRKQREEGKGKGGCRRHSPPRPKKKKHKSNNNNNNNNKWELNAHKMSPLEMNTLPSAIVVQDDCYVHYGIFVAFDWDSEDGGLKVEYHDCTFINEVKTVFGTVINKGDKAKLVTFNADTGRIKIYKDDKVYSFSIAYTLFGMKVEEDSESTDSDVEEGEAE